MKQVRLGATLCAEVEQFAAAHGLSFTDTLEFVIGAGLDSLLAEEFLMSVPQSRRPAAAA